LAPALATIRRIMDRPPSTGRLLAPRQWGHPLLGVRDRDETLPTVALGRRTILGRAPAPVGDEAGLERRPAMGFGSHLVVRYLRSDTGRGSWASSPSERPPTSS